MIPSNSNVPDIDLTVEAPVFAITAPLPIPVLLTPADKTLFYLSWLQQMTSVVFTWLPVTGAVSYEIEVCEDSSFSSILKVVLTAAGTTVTAAASDLQFVYTKKYYWRVRAISGFISSPWSLVWEFGFNKQTPAEFNGQNEYQQDGNLGETTLEITTELLPGYKVGVPYAVVIQARGGVPPYSWFTVSGGVMQGTAFDAFGGIEGTPTAAAFGVYRIVVGVQDSDGNVTTREFFISNEDDVLGYDPIYKAVLATPAAGSARYPVCPKVSGNLPGATDGDIWFDTSV